jgi:hypothetical protein
LKRAFSTLSCLYFFSEVVDEDSRRIHGFALLEGERAKHAVISRGQTVYLKVAELVGHLEAGLSNGGVVYLPDEVVYYIIV